MNISIIVAMAMNNVIGSNNKIPWYLPEDLQYFKSITINKPIIMGRKTFESLPKLLPNREHIVISRNAEVQSNNTDRVHWVGSLEDAITTAANFLDESNDEIIIIGGGEIYRQAMSIANKLYLTKIAAEFVGDVKFPVIDEQQWKLVSEEHLTSSIGDKLNYSNQIYTRRR